MNGKPRSPYERKVLATYGAEGPKGRNAPKPGPRKYSDAAEGPKPKRNVPTSRVSPSARSEGIKPPRKRTQAEMAYAKKMGAEGPKKSTSRGATTMLGSEGPKRDASLMRRKQQNAGVKAGTMRTGAGGRTQRKYNAKTGRWDIVSVLPKYK